MILKIPSHISVKKLAELMKTPVPKVIMELMKNGVMATINEEIDYDTASLVAMSFEFEPAMDDKELAGQMTLEEMLKLCAEEVATSERNLEERAPIVTILGHVDHGKTTLLDTIRKANVAAGEAGGITQRISAYQAKKHGKLITFIDTPGHEAFSGMRKRGISIADIAILVVAADDGVRPQTKEVIEYIKEQKLPVIVAINKIDKEDARADRVKQEIAEQGLLFEGWGGETMCIEISAKGNINIDKLLDAVLLIAEVERFRANARRDALGVILESHLDPQKGPVATALIRTGALKVGQDIVAGSKHGRVRRIENYLGKNIDTALPSMPITLYGFTEAPQVNDVLQVVDQATLAKAKKEALMQEIAGRKAKMDDGLKRLPMIVKADVQGSVEAIMQILDTISHPEVALDIIDSGVGAITESDVKIASGAGAYIYGFNVEPTPVAARMAEGKVTIQKFNIIYKLVEKVKSELGALLEPETVRTDSGRLSVLMIFKSGKRDTILGGRVASGKMLRGSLIEVERDGEVVGTGKMTNLQQNKKNADEVTQGSECGLVFEGNVKVLEGDTLICYKEEQKKRTLE
jgi:translation initiation factor IF-2